MILCFHAYIWVQCDILGSLSIFDYMPLLHFFFIMKSPRRKKKEKGRMLLISWPIHYENNRRKLNIQIVLKLIYFQMLSFFTF